MAEEQVQEGRLIGSISHYFGRISVGIIDLTDTLRVGDTIHVKGATTDFTQTIESMQLEHEQVDEGTAGQSVGVKVDEHVREGDKVFVV
jgi:translation elongation factor EF-Tu-like GTPase